MAIITMKKRGRKMPVTTEAARRMAARQAMANSRIEGHQPTQEHVTRMEQLVKGVKTPEQARQEILAAHGVVKLPHAA